MEGGEKLRDYFRKKRKIYDYDDLKSEEKVEEVTSNIFDYLDKDERVNRAEANKKLIEEKTVPVVIGEVKDRNIEYAEEIKSELKSENLDELEKVEIDEEYNPKTVQQLKMQLGKRKSDLRGKEAFKERLFADPDLIRRQRFRTWNAVQDWYNLTDEELEKFKSENDSIELR